MHIEKLRKQVGREEIDYQILLSALSDYAQPRNKISHWLRSGNLIRVKKGLYVFGKEASRHPYSLPLLANLIYGPSAVSLQYAMSFYGMIPERVTTITSITSKRNKTFSTPVGDFSYRYLPFDKYAVGLDIQHDVTQSSFLIVTPEKALCDYIYLVDKKISFDKLTDIMHYLCDDLRIDETALKKLNKKIFAEIVKSYQDPRLEKLLMAIKTYV